jgi:hypothetical protein
MYIHSRHHTCINHSCNKQTSVLACVNKSPRALCEDNGTHQPISNRWTECLRFCPRNIWECEGELRMLSVTGIPLLDRLRLDLTTRISRAVAERCKTWMSELMRRTKCEVSRAVYSIQTPYRIVTSLNSSRFCPPNLWAVATDTDWMKM